MAAIETILEQCRDAGLCDEYGEPLDVRFEAPASERRLARLEHSVGQRIPTSVRKLLSFSNGMVLFRHAFPGARAMRLFRSRGLLAFHDWGTLRDVDCIALGSSQWPEGTIVFVNGSPDRAVAYHDSLEGWLAEVLEETHRYKYWYAPGNYRRFGARGVAWAAMEAAERLGWSLDMPTAKQIRRHEQRPWRLTGLPAWWPF